MSPSHSLAIVVQFPLEFETELVQTINQIAAENKFNGRLPLSNHTPIYTSTYPTARVIVFWFDSSQDLQNFHIQASDRDRYISFFSLSGQEYTLEPEISNTTISS